jgi:UDP-3-O-[3-hydroxymyristoyl] glucosamine N-acyltransferase
MTATTPANSETNTPRRSLKALAEALNGRLVGNGDWEVSTVAHPRHIQSEHDLVLMLEPQALAALEHPQLKAAIVPEGIAVPDEALSEYGIQGYIAVPRPRYALAILLEIFDKPTRIAAGIHPTAMIADTAQLGDGVTVGPYATIGEHARIGARTIIHGNATIGAEAQLGDDCQIHAGVRIGDRVEIGHRVIIQPNAVIGADGFSYATPEAGSVESAKAGGAVGAQNTGIRRINSIGTVVLEDDVEIGACACVDRATLGATRIGRGTKLDNLVQIGHNNTVGEDCLIVSQVGIAGSCKIGNRVVIGGQTGFADHLTVGDDAILMAKSGVMKDVPEKAILGGAPAIPRRQILENLANVNKLKDAFADLKTLKKQLAALEAELTRSGVLTAADSEALEAVQ